MIFFNLYNILSKHLTSMDLFMFFVIVCGYFQFMNNIKELKKRHNILLEEVEGKVRFDVKQMILDELEIKLPQLINDQIEKIDLKLGILTGRDDAFKDALAEINNRMREMNTLMVRTNQ